MPQKVTWARQGGYECSSRGDRRFSALGARMPDGRSIEEHYQCDVKGYEPGGTNWRLGKGQPALNPHLDLWKEYLALWQAWAAAHPALIEQLAELARQHDSVLTDMFASTPINQARALAEILNHYHASDRRNQTHSHGTAARQCAAADAPGKLADRPEDW